LSNKLADDTLPFNPDEFNTFERQYLQAE